MDFDSPDVERDFPGLYASEGADGRSRRSKEDSDYSDGEHEKISRKDLLIGRRKDKKDKGKDRGYAALEGESSPEDDNDVKSPLKSKKSKAFKFSSSKSKEKCDKSREKELKEEEKLKEKERLEKEKGKDNKKKDKERKDKDKKDKGKEKDKERKEKKSKRASISIDEGLELGSPVFGVSVSLASERSRCHDGIDLPLVVRDCIDYLQEHALKSEQIYRVEPLKTRLLHYKQLYNSRERDPETDELDIPTACGLLKLFLRELPEPILTTDLIAQFEEVASHPEIRKQQEELRELLDQLPSCNNILLSWILIHFDAVIRHERHNKMTAQSLAMLLSPPLQMSHRLLVTLLCHCSSLYPEVQLIKYVPPLTSSSPNLPETPREIQVELGKQESLLAQIHSEMNAGFVSKKREEQLWEVQRIITQLKRKLRSFERKQEKSIEDVGLGKPSLGADTPNNSLASTDLAKRPETTHTSHTSQPKSNSEQGKATIRPEDHVKEAKKEQHNSNLPDHVALYVDECSGLLMVPKSHPEYANLIRLQLENRELLAWKAQLQARISAERAEILRLKQVQQTQSTASSQAQNSATEALPLDGDYGRIIEHYMRENALLEQKKKMLAKQIFEERRECIALQVELAMRKF